MMVVRVAALRLFPSHLQWTMQQMQRAMVISEAEACMAGDQNSCRELQKLTASDEYRALNRFRSERHKWAE